MLLCSDNNVHINLSIFPFYSIFQSFCFPSCVTYSPETWTKASNSILWNFYILLQINYFFFAFRRMKNIAFIVKQTQTFRETIHQVIFF